MRDALAAVLAEVLGERVVVRGLHILTGGASRTTWAFEAETSSRVRSLILQIARRGGPPASMEREAHVQALARSAGAPVPQVLIAADSSDLLGDPFLVTEAVGGETIGRKILRGLDQEGRSRVLVDCARSLAAIHRSEPSQASSSQSRLEAIDPLVETRDWLNEIGDTTAVFEWALRWLALHRPPQAHRRLVHGDFRMGNLIVDDAQLAAVLDWEGARIGEPAEDVAWFCAPAWRFGAPASRAAGGLGSIRDFLEAYENAGGPVIGPARFLWWSVMAALRWGVICRLQAHRHLSGQNRSVELAAIGRRACEAEWDILELFNSNRAPLQ
ncbi:acyl-CoA dehydrogenase [Mycobacterium sp. GA-1999]|nr:acyl-CoA dehydrogenase [Mycobacterium sp. GA-0227b]KUH87806.1 acyl-CoA dehydrogenase [Mycobacterium sp. GA-1999]KUH88698.1 acyl-CoA dehydrogenase [Mycobacterium sp. IS-1556]